MCANPAVPSDDHAASDNRAGSEPAARCRRNTLSSRDKMECSDGSGLSSGVTTAEKTELWDRWQRGESLKAIGRAFGKPSSSIYFQVSPHGGIRPAPRRHQRLALTLSEREEISRGIAVHRSARSMAGLLGRSPSTVSREISRNGGYDGYRAALADENAWKRARRPKRCSWRPIPGYDKPELRLIGARARGRAVSGERSRSPLRLLSHQSNPNQNVRLSRDFYNYCQRAFYGRFLLDRKDAMPQ